MVIKYRRPTSASRVGQDMRNTWSHVVGNLATLVLLALAGCLGYLFWPYLPTLAWAQLVAFSLRGLRDRFKSVKYGIFYKRGAELSDSQAATRLMIYVALGSMLLGVLLTVGLAGDAVSGLAAARRADGYDDGERREGAAVAPAARTVARLALRRAREVSVGLE